MKNWPVITTDRAVEIYLSAVECRGETPFVNIPDLIEDLFQGSSGWKISLYDSGLGDDYERKAAVVAGFDRFTLIVDKELWERAKAGEGFANFVLAHELGHIQLNHHKFRSVIKHYRLVAIKSGLANIPPTLEEYEANLWAVFFQCGTHLENPKWGALALARAAHSEVSYVKRALGYLNVPAFKNKLSEVRKRKPAPRQIF